MTVSPREAVKDLELEHLEKNSEGSDNQLNMIKKRILTGEDDATDEETVSQEIYNDNVEKLNPHHLLPMEGYQPPVGPAIDGLGNLGDEKDSFRTSSSGDAT